ncbi:MAG TPA: ribosomal-protein-alanine acetyltransferase, partial [Nocardioides sp.]|nr:ribosomal-protein-alanine acetyltransferase [Nocardioides sp.]
MTVRRAAVGDVPAIAALERDNLGDDAWSPALVEEGVRGNLPTIVYLVAEVATGDGPTVVGHAVA